MDRRQQVAALGRQVAGLLALMFGSVAGFQMGRHVSLWMQVRQHGGALPADAASLALPFAIAAFAAAMASRSRSVRAITAGLLIVFATVGMLAQRLMTPPPADLPAVQTDAGP